MANKAIENNIIVTGGTTGIGLAIVLRLLQDEYNVGFFGSSEERVKAAVKTAQNHGFSEDVFLARRVDLRAHEQIGSFVKEFNNQFGPVGGLVNSAGISPKLDGKRIPLHETSIENWQDVFDVNLISALICLQHVLPSMMEKKFGRIVMIGSVASRALPRFAGCAYVASKAGLGGLARSVASEYAVFGITANTVAPGNIATEMTGGINSPQNLAAAMNIPAGRIGEPEDLAGIVAFLCSKEARFINGATIDVTGAEYISP
ncbi:SDR family NAD(P)-dependent oxidoreductase [Lentilitoribacter sp. EG35]|uniref:SDR family NAD(P)-dependent oxidoreductase n=1 Tax=Lentilitoribacter sp. EG35 TaxID=3234192 RepID=UPI00345FEEF7